MKNIKNIINFIGYSIGYIVMCALASIGVVFGLTSGSDAPVPTNKFEIIVGITIVFTFFISLPVLFYAYQVVVKKRKSSEVLKKIKDVVDKLDASGF